MGKILVRNKLGQKTLGFNLPADSTTAETFCSTFLDGEYIGYTTTSESGTDTATTYNDVRMQISNTAGYKAYLNFCAKSSMSETDIYAALVGNTFNGVEADKLVIIGMRGVTL